MVIGFSDLQALNGCLIEETDHRKTCEIKALVTEIKEGLMQVSVIF